MADFGIDAKSLSEVFNPSAAQGEILVHDGTQYAGLAIGASAQILVSNGTTLAYKAVSGDITIDANGVVAIAANSIVNADINSAAAIAFSKLASLTSAQILVGSATNVVTAVAMSGDVTISNTGVTTVADDSHLHTNATVTLASTDLTDSAALARNTDNLSFFAATTSAQLRGVISDEVGTGVLVFAQNKAEFDSALTDDNFAYVGQNNNFSANQTIAKATPTLSLIATSGDPTIIAQTASGLGNAIHRWTNAGQGVFDIKYDRTNNELQIIEPGALIMMAFDNVSNNVEIPNDNEKLLFGAGLDASIYYNGTNLVIDPREVGTGNLTITNAQIIGLVPPTGVVGQINITTDISTGSFAVYDFLAHDSLANDTIYVRLNPQVQTNTDGNESGYFNINIMSNGTLTNLMQFIGAVPRVDVNNADFSIDALKKLYVDGGGDTYAIESSANVIDWYTGASWNMRNKAGLIAFPSSGAGQGIEFTAGAGGTQIGKITRVNNMLRLDAFDSVVIGKAGTGTTRTTDFLYVPTSAGTPTGAPTGETGYAPIVIDTTNHKLYFYSGGSWRDAGP